MTDHHDVELYRERIPDLVEYLKGDQIQRAIDSGQPIINITINEAPRPAPAPPPEQDVATKYAGHLVLATWSAIVFAGLAFAFMILAQAIMIAMISLAVCALAVAAAIKYLRTSKEEAKAAARGRRRHR
jgi:uncharacterized membrane protein YgcG